MTLSRRQLVAGLGAGFAQGLPRTVHGPVDPTDEIAFTRGGTEALQNLIAGYNRLRPADAVMYADLDYHSCQYAMNWLRDRRGGVTRAGLVADLGEMVQVAVDLAFVPGDQDAFDVAEVPVKRRACDASLLGNRCSWPSLTPVLTRAGCWTSGAGPVSTCS
jgi:hypothetical protein